MLSRMQNVMKKARVFNMYVACEDKIVILTAYKTKYKG